jgi:hypothetical protein
VLEYAAEVFEKIVFFVKRSAGVQDSQNIELVVMEKVGDKGGLGCKGGCVEASTIEYADSKVVGGFGAVAGCVGGEGGA